MDGGSCTHLSAEDLCEALFSAIEERHGECVNLLLQKGADVNKRNSDYNTPLVRAAEVGNVDVLKCLISAGANVNMPGSHLGSPLYRAVVNNHIQCVEILIDAGANVNWSYSKGLRLSVLMYAVARGYTKCAETLIAGGANVNLSTRDGETAVMTAAREVQSECIKLLIKFGADVNMVGEYNFTALIWTARQSSSRVVDCIKILLRAGALINKFDNVGQNALLNSMRNDYKSYSNDEAAMLLFAAGEILEGEIAGCKVNASAVVIPEFLRRKELKFCLKHLCREAIRKHLINLDPHTHLFGRIPQLRLPSSLSKYLLYYLSLDA